MTGPHDVAALRGVRSPSASPRRRLAALAVLGLTVALIAAAVGVSTTVDVAAVAERPPREPVPLPPPTAGALHCPLTGVDDQAAELSIAAVGDAPAVVEVTRHDSGEPVVDATEELEVGEVLVVAIDDDVDQPRSVSWTGGAVTAMWRLDTPDAAAATCAPAAAPTWYLTGFDTTDANEAYLYLFNPFPSDAVARITYATPEGPQSLTGTAAVAVEGHSGTRLDLTELQPQVSDLGVVVEVTAGRMVAGGQDLAIPSPGLDGRSGRSAVEAATQPATDVATAWARTDGPSGTSWLSIMNPNDREVAVQISASTPGPETDVVGGERTVAAGSTLRVPLDGISEAAEYGVRVTTDGAEGVVVAQATAVTTTEGGEGQTIALARPAEARWGVAGLVGGGSRRDRLSVLNPSPEPVTVQIDAGPATPAEWRAVQIDPNGRAAFDLVEVGGEALAVIVVADGPVIAEGRGFVPGEAPGLWTSVSAPESTWTGPRTRPQLLRDLGLPTEPTPATDEP